MKTSLLEKLIVVLSHLFSGKTIVIGSMVWAITEYEMRGGTKKIGLGNFYIVCDSPEEFFRKGSAEKYKFIPTDWSFNDFLELIEKTDLTEIGFSTREH